MNSIIELATIKHLRSKEVMQRQEGKERERALVREIARLERTNEYIVMRTIVGLSLALTLGFVTGALWT